MVRLIGSGIAGFIAVTGLLGLLASAFLFPRRQFGCIVEPRPEPAFVVMVFALACGTAALLGCARQATAGFVGGFLLLAAALSVSRHAAAGADTYAIVLGVMFLVVATLATCIEQFPTQLLRKTS